MNYKNWIWDQADKFGCQLDARYYYSRLMRTLEGEVFVVNALAERNGIAIDIGANLGIWSYHLSKLFVRVEAFEPVADCCGVIRNTRRKNICVHNEGLSSVPLRTLDDHAFANVKFIRIDVGGHEIEVLKGAIKTITAEKPVMIIEIEQRHLDFPMDNVFELLKSYGYEAFFLSGRKLRRYAEFSYEMDQLPYLNNLSSIFYVHNFIFLPMGKRL